MPWNATALISPTVTSLSAPVRADLVEQIQALSAELLTLTTTKQGTKPRPAIRAKPNDSTKQPKRAS
ncbi:hypothetical protein SAMN04487914_13924 [Arthrobacter sp. ok909]|nr:hypothetical protein SAMN04487914_13924 [Arthrobacter sp. ok909]